MEHKFSISVIRLVESHFALNRKYKWDGKESVELQQSIDIKPTYGDKDLNVMVTISSDSEKQPFRFSVAWEGIFVFDNMPAKEMLERLAHINCAAIIFPYVRETVADLTRRANIPPLNLPPVNFVTLFEERQENAKEAPARKPRQKPQKKRSA